MLREAGFRGVTLDEAGIAPDPAEDGIEVFNTFEENATAKARWFSARAGGMPVLADDSGLCVDALGGAPGVHSARFAAMDTGASGNSSDAANNAKLLRLLAAKPDAPRTARFRCVIALAAVRPAGPTRFFEGACEGSIESAARGAGGFGYDPLFVPRGFSESFAELGEEIKNRISHREIGRAHV